MQTKIIDHKLQKITIAYGYNNNPWTDQDEALIEALEMLYDEEGRMNAETDALMTEYFAVNKEMAALREELGVLATAIENLNKNADALRKYFGFPAPQAFVDLSYEAAEVSKLVDPYRDKFIEHQQKMNKLCDRLNMAQRAAEDIDIWDAYSDVKYAHVENYETNSIDIVQYGQVDQELHTYHSHYADKRRSKQERCREIHDDHRCFAMEFSLQLALWNGFVKHMSLLGYIFGKKDMLPGVWEN